MFESAEVADDPLTVVVQVCDAVLAGDVEADGFLGECLLLDGFALGLCDRVRVEQTLALLDLAAEPLSVGSSYVRPRSRDSPALT
jgi:hypothetical protein